MFFLVDWFNTFLYQPFLNLLVGVYLLLDFATGGNADMGVAVIIFTIAFRVLWTPVSLASSRTYKERLAITKRVEKIEELYKHDLIKKKDAVKKVFRGNSRIVISSALNIFLQTLISLMLWRIFAQGLRGEDLHLLYGFMPEVEGDFNLVFMDRFDLTQPSLILNFCQAFVIFVLEALDALFSPERKYRREIVMAQFVLPVVSFIMFIMLPAGKKLFIITTITYSIGLLLFRQIMYLFQGIGKRMDDAAAKAQEKSDAIDKELKEFDQSEESNNQEELEKRKRDS